MRLWDLATGAPVAKLEQPCTNGVCGLEVAVALDSGRVVALSEECRDAETKRYLRSATVWCLATHTCLNHFPRVTQNGPGMWERARIAPLNPRQAMLWVTERFFESGDYFRPCSDEAWWVVDAWEGTLEKMSPEGVDRIHLVLSDGRIVWEDKCRRLRIHDRARPGAEIVLTGHEDPVEGVLELPDGRVVSWGQSGGVRVWDPASGALISVVAGPPGGVGGVATDAGQRLLSWGAERAIRVWGMGHARA